ncbi:sulfur carrier protein ThiS [Mobilicoccus massiliensis]|uniref:sulfur carrier protein ThiS n=1 Tax=Mobilicoccus massiliensis TaxID=1522310 RepID=UPI00058B8AA2|nr:sulfur carrier protein ThiS [Mobilicoccus massiliensis]
MTDIGEVSITLNDTPRRLPAGATLRDLVAMETGRQIGDDGRAASGEGLGVALARDGEVVPRGAWAYTEIADGDRFELVTAVQGG